MHTEFELFNKMTNYTFAFILESEELHQQKTNELEESVYRLKMETGRIRLLDSFYLMFLLMTLQIEFLASVCRNSNGIGHNLLMKDAKKSH